MAGKCVGPGDAVCLNDNRPHKMGSKLVRAYAESRLSGAANISEGANTPLNLVSIGAAATFNNPAYKFETAVP